MTFNKLPERLRNLPGFQLVTGEDLVMTVNESKMQMLESVFVPIYKKQDAKKGAV